MHSMMVRAMSRMSSTNPSTSARNLMPSSMPTVGWLSLNSGPVGTSVRPNTECVDDGGCGPGKKCSAGKCAVAEVKKDAERYRKVVKDIGLQAQ